jgi:ribonuclease J
MIENIGALPYLLQAKTEFNIYCSRLTSLKVRSMLKKYNSDESKIIEVEPDQKIKLSPNIEVNTLSTFSSSPLSLAYLVKTSYGFVAHFADFIYSNDKSFLFNTNLRKISSIIKNENVLLLSSAVNNVEKTGFTTPSFKTGAFFEKILRANEGRVFTTFYDHDVYQIFSLINICKMMQRPIFIYGRTFDSYFKYFTESKIVNFDSVVRISPDQIETSKNCVVIIVGTIETIFHKISKIANGFEELFKITQLDTFVCMCMPINGSEILGNKALDEISRLESKLVTPPRSLPQIKGKIEDIKLLVNYLNPRFIIPHTGLYKDMTDFGKAARECGFRVNDNFILMYNGEKFSYDASTQKMEIDEKFLKLTEKYVDSEGLSDLGAMILSEREQMSVDGVAIVSLAIDKKTKKVVSTVDVQMRGVVFVDKDSMERSEKLQKSIVELVNEFAETSAANHDIKELRNIVKKKTVKIIEKLFKKEPIVLPSIIEI